MSSLVPIACLVTLTGLALGGFTSNAFIIAVIVTEWAKSRSLNSSALLLLSLGMSNICCTASLGACTFDSLFQPIFSTLTTAQALYTFWNIAMLSRFWFTAWLCVFYCIKIVNSTHSLSLWCKQRISWLLPWILLASAAISILASVFAVHLVPVHLQNNTSTVNITDMGREELEIKILPSFITFFLVIGSSCPLLVVLLGSIVTVASLYRHVCQMRGKEFSFRDPQTEAHFKAAGTVLSLLFLYLSFYIAQVLVSMTRMKENKIANFVCAMVIMGYSLAQAAILVWVNPKLKQAIPRMLPGRKP
ncbi:taste receptor type 2 member 8-like [Tiliqua scincoides]|uniref:taste receptor type 2 member 8-like n=1 Tax=Tiliqua scincoides TaxID=71010 RepID=UPI003461A906